MATSVDWKAYRFGYEYDFISRPSFFVGFVTEVRYDSVTVSMSSPTATGGSRVRTPLPMAGGIVRIYPLSDLSLTAELIGMKLPARVRELTGTTATPTISISTPRSTSATTLASEAATAR